VSQFCTPEQNEEILNSFNKHEQDGFDRSELDDHQMMMGEDVNYSPDSSVRIPHTSFTDEGAISERQNRFQQDRLSNIHGKVENKRTTAPKVKRDTQRMLESVKEERESDSRVYNELDNSHTIEQFVEEEFKQSVSDRDDIDTEVIVAEIDSSDLERYGKISFTQKLSRISLTNLILDLGYIPKRSYHEHPGYKMDKQYIENSPGKAYNYHENYDDGNVVSSGDESGFTDNSYDSN
jgi:hypothetical protein